MRTLATKIDNTLANKFLKVCDNEGKSVSQKLRECITQSLGPKPEPKIIIKTVEKPRASWVDLLVFRYPSPVPFFFVVYLLIDY